MFEEKCKKCGKNFITAPFHIYHDHRGYYCSWTCYLHRNDGNEKKERARGVERYKDPMGEVESFESAVKAAAIINGSVNSIRNACKNHTLYRGYVWRYKNDVS